jgi:predicted protein tyrosine phosphatase
MNDVIVCGHDLASELLRADVERRIRHIVSIRDPDVEPPDGLREHPARRIELRFHDVHDDTPHDGHFAPKREDIERLVEFCAGIDLGTTLIHCRAGIGRSTASAYVLLCMRHGAGREETALDELFAITTGRLIIPNRTVIRHADAILGRGGAMLAAHRARFMQWYGDDED